MGLRADELLFLEGAEDFNLCSNPKAVATQVKDQGGRNVTLRSVDAVEVVNNYWVHRGRNKDRRICLRFLTRLRGGRPVRRWTAVASTPGRPLSQGKI